MLEERRGPGRPRKEDAPIRAREDRAEEEQRRRKSRSPLGPTQRLHVSESALDRKNYDYRWVLGTELRMARMTKEDDWTPVLQDGTEIKEDASDLGSAVSVIAGADKSGAPVRQYLCRKPLKWAKEDRAELEERRRKVEQQINGGVAEDDPTSRDPAFYRGNQGPAITRE